MSIKERNIYITMYVIALIGCILVDKNIESLLMFILISLTEIKYEVKKINKNKI